MRNENKQVILSYEEHERLLRDARAYEEKANSFSWSIDDYDSVIKIYSFDKSYQHQIDSLVNKKARKQTEELRRQLEKVERRKNECWRRLSELKKDSRFIRFLKRIGL